ncbi:hypothetical protein GCM10025857_00900 [Alicyclobacillus contaminans]|uniref:hypothetical protein n=1 Tax=Alicyclobacillus contaminans TaxID=392016 RepID=UPI00041026A0|nr:hypothetical protein [Alicyclobacillus contaminans]GMA48733.1 hypothetical protein GCM10025857_00900 [Alicyclobacillus contaminans]
MTRIRLIPVVVIALVSLLVLFGGWWAYRKYNVINPLTESLQHVTGVESVQVNPSSPSSISIQLGPVTDLQTTYQTISRAVEQVFGSGSSVAMTLEDHRDAALTNIYETDMAPILAEAIQKGEYTQMVAMIQQKAKQLHVTAKVSMDDQNIYLQLQQGSYYLYHVRRYSALQQGGGVA